MLVVILGVKFWQELLHRVSHFPAALTNHLLHDLVAILTLTAAWAAMPSVQIKANPEVVIIPAGASFGSTLISWTTTNYAACGGRWRKCSGRRLADAGARRFRRGQAGLFLGIGGYADAGAGRTCLYRFGSGG